MNIDEISPEIVNRVRNGLTEFRSSFKLVNFQIFSCYRGLPSRLRCVAEDLFWAIIRNRKNGKDEGTKKGEANRIYNDAYTPIEVLLMDCNCLRYANGKSKPKNDISNYLKKIRDLDAMNVHYYWNYEGIPMYIMERETGSWKLYNKSGYVIPKTIKKIVALSGYMTKAMARFVAKENKKIDVLGIERSFCKFLSKRMIGKTNPSVSSKINLWDGKQSLSEYILYLKGVLKTMGDFDGLITKQDYDDRLPLSVRTTFEKDLTLAEAEDMKKNKSKEIETQLGEAQNAEKTLAEELTPQKPIIAKKRRGRKPKMVNVEVTDTVIRPPAQPEALRFNEEINPLQNAKDFVVYYRQCIMSATGGRVKFENFELDAPIAAQILDKLIIMGKADKIFIRAWIKYFFDQKLKGAKAMKPKYVGMNAFMETLEPFNKIFCVEQ